VMVFSASTKSVSCGIELVRGVTTCDDDPRADDRSGSVALRTRGAVENGELAACDGALFNRER